MLQTLLADRFKLAVHNETKPVPAFVLSRGSGELKMTLAEPSGDTGCKAGPPPEPHPYAAVSCHNMTMQGLLQMLSVNRPYIEDKPIVDSTGPFPTRGRRIAPRNTARTSRSADGRFRPRAPVPTVLTYPGKTDTVLSVPHYDFNWQLAYYPAKPIHVPKGGRESRAS
jgi:hypothetical protein